MIGYYIHHHGHGHLVRAQAISAQLDVPVTAFSSLKILERHPFHHTVLLPRDDNASAPEGPTAGGVLHWAPRHDEGLQQRMAVLSEWVRHTRPTLVIVDVSVEVAVLMRLLGVPVVVIAMPGDRTDPAHTLAFELAEHIIAPWPEELHVPNWLRKHRDKTTYVGGISRFTGREKTPAPAGRPRVTVLSGNGGTTWTARDVEHCAQRNTQYEWVPIGVPGSPWVEDPWPYLSTSSVVVGHAGQNVVADIAAAAAPALLIAQDRPYSEQHSTAATLQENSLAVVLPRWPAGDDWPGLLQEAETLGGSQWARWRTDGAAERAADTIKELSKRWKTT